MTLTRLLKLKTAPLRVGQYLHTLIIAQCYRKSTQ